MSQNITDMVSLISLIYRMQTAELV